MPSAASVALIAPPLAFSGIAVIVGALGAIASMTKLVVNGADWMPVGLLATIVTTVLPLGNGVVGVTCQVPSGLTTSVSLLPSGSVTVMVSPGVPVPLIAGVVSAVISSPTMPVSEPGSSLPVGLPGGRLLIAMASAGDVALMLPAAS